MTGCGCHDPVVFGHHEHCTARQGTARRFPPSAAVGVADTILSRRLEQLAEADRVTRPYSQRKIDRMRATNEALGALIKRLSGE